MADYSLGVAELGTAVNMDGFNQGMGQAQQAAQGGADMVGNSFSTALGIGLAAAGGMVLDKVQGIFGAISSGVESNLKFETYETQFAVLFKATDEFKARAQGLSDPLEQQAIAAEMAQGRIQELATFAATTPFDLPGVVESSKILQGFGMYSEESAAKFGSSGAEILTTAGDVASGTGAKFQDISLLLGKFAAGATGEAISRFQELGITTREEMTKMGLEFSKSGQLMSPVPEAMETVLGIMKDKYGGMMAEQSKTFDGMKSNLDDWKEGAMRTMAAPIFDVFKENLGTFLQFTTDHADQISAILTSVGNVIASVLGTALGFLTGTLLPALGAAFDAFTTGSVNGFSGGLANVLYSLESVSPIFGVLGDAVLFAGDILASLGVTLSDLADQAMGWGENIIDQLAGGMERAAGGVMNALGNIGGMITGLLRPGSPPKLLPELTTWGTGAIDAYMEGWGKGDMTVFNGIGNAIESSIKQINSASGGKNTNIADIMIGSQSAIADAINEVHRVGSVSEETFQKIITAAGPAGSGIVGIARAYLDLERTTQDVENAQSELNGVTEEYNAKLTPLNANLRAIQDKKQAIQDQERLTELQKTAGDASVDANKRQLAVLEIQEIQMRQQIKTTENERDVAVDAAKAKLDAAKEAQAQAKEQVDQQQQMLAVNKKQNDLVAEQTKAMADVAKAMQGAAASSAANAEQNEKLNETVTKVSDVIGNVSDTATEVGNVFNSVATPAVQGFQLSFGLLGQIISQVISAVSPVLNGLMALFTAVFDSIVNAVTQNSDLILNTIVTHFTTILSAVTGILSSLSGVIASVLDVIVGFIEQNGTQIVSTIIQAWAAAQAAVDTTINIISNIIQQILGQVQIFIQNHGAEIQAFMLQAWTQISTIVQTAIQLYNSIIPPVLSFIQNLIATHGAEIQAIIGGAWTIISNVISAALAIIQGVLTAALQIIQGNWSGAWETIKTMTSAVWTNLSSVVDGAVQVLRGIIQIGLDAITGIFSSSFEAVRKVITGFAADAVKLGSDIVGGIKKGITEAWDNLVEGVSNLMDTLLGRAKKKAETASPSKAWEREIGIPLVQGIKAGVITATPELIQQLEMLGDEMLTPLEDAQKMAHDIFADMVNAGVSNARLALSNFDTLTKISDDAAKKVEENAQKMADAYQNLIDVQAQQPSADVAVEDQKKIADAQQNVIDVQDKYATQMANTADSLDLLHKKLGDVEKGTTQYDSIMNQIVAKERAMTDLREKQAQAIQDAQDKVDKLNEEARASSAEAQAQYEADVAAAQQAYQETNAAYNEALRQQMTAGTVVNNANAQLAEAQAQAAEISKTNAQAGADFLRLRSAQILEMAKLEQDRLTAEANNDNAGMIRAQQRIDLVKAAQAAELTQFQLHSRDLAAQQQAALDSFSSKGQEFADKMLELGMDMESAFKIGDMIANIVAATPGITEAMQGVVDGIINTLRNGLGIASPSKVAAMLLGGPISEGIALGITQKTDVVSDAVAKTAANAFSVATTNFNESLTINANYKHQDERSLRDDVTMVHLLRGQR